MRNHCLACEGPLDAGTVVLRQAPEGVPRASFVAYDPAASRIWAICPRCGEWNLAPIETDEAEGLIGSLETVVETARERVSTGRLSLARPRDGGEVVRLDLPRHPERTEHRRTYELLRRRRLTTLAKATPGAGLLIGIGAAGVAGLLNPHLTVILIAAGGGVSDFWRRGKLGTGRNEPGVSLEDARHTVVLAVAGDPGWVVRIGAEGTVFRGEAGEALLATTLRILNRFGASRREAGTAWSLAEAHGGLDAALAKELDFAEAEDGRRAFLPGKLPRVRRLALEVALLEAEHRRADRERAAELERGWEQAEEIAQIMDEL